MKCKVDQIDDKLVFNFEIEPSSGDQETHRHATFIKHECYINVPKDYLLTNTHPDLIALSAILMILPFLGDELTINTGCSKAFAKEFYKRTKKTLTSVDSSLTPRNPDKLNTPALAYSGGVDSTAAVSLLPDHTKLIFLDRPIADQKETLYRKDAANFACRELSKLGKSVHQIECNLELMRNPTGFPVDFANSVPAILLADHLALDSIAFGMIMESAYKSGHDKFLDAIKRGDLMKWSNLFRAAGVPLNLVTAGISEVGTSKIALSSVYGYVAQSCMRGMEQKPCKNCWKCFRKSLLDECLKGKQPTDKELDRIFEIKEARIVISKNLIKHQNVVSYFCNKYEGDHELLGLLKKKACYVKNSEIYEKWYAPSIELIVPKYRGYVENKISDFLETMNHEESEKLRALDLTEVLTSEQYIEDSTKLKVAIKQHADDIRKRVEFKKELKAEIKKELKAEIKKEIKKEIKDSILKRLRLKR